MKRFRKKGIYFGVKDYGDKTVNKDNKDHFCYRFDIDGKEKLFRIMNGKKDDEGHYNYPIQNILKEGYRYMVSIDGDAVSAAAEIKDTEVKPYAPPVRGTPGKRTIKNFLKTALEPVGTTLYVYGGGWNWQDTGASVQARKIGISPDWVMFFNSKDENYTYKETDGDEAKADPKHSYYPYGGYNQYYFAGLDCSGFAGWAVYNTFETKDGNAGYVGPASGFAKRLSEKGWGEWTQDVTIPDGNNGYAMKPGDIISTNGHVWISLGTCTDGSVVIVHSTPSMSRKGQPGGGVQVSAVGNDASCLACKIAGKYMSTYHPEWYRRYPVTLCDPSKFFAFEGECAGRFSWDTGYSPGLTDPDGFRDMTPDKVLEALLSDAGLHLCQRYPR